MRKTPQCGQPPMSWNSGRRPSPGPSHLADRSSAWRSSAGAQKLGANWFTVGAGLSVAPLHAHHNNEEAIFVLHGRGTLQIGEKRVSLRAGDWVSPPGRPGSTPIRCLPIRTGT